MYRESWLCRTTFKSCRTIPAGYCYKVWVEIIDLLYRSNRLAHPLQYALVSLHRRLTNDKRNPWIIGDRRLCPFHVMESSRLLHFRSINVRRLPTDRPLAVPPRMEYVFAVTRSRL